MFEAFAKGFKSSPIQEFSYKRSEVCTELN